MKRRLSTFVPMIGFLDLANVVTTANVGVAMLTVCSAKFGRFDLAASFMCLAAVLDFVDGHIARTRLAASTANRAFGQQLDSLADLLNFSVAPTLTVLSMFETIEGAAAGVLLTLSGCLRLALFNALPASRDGYVGLPTTYAGVILAITTLAWSYSLISSAAISALVILIAALQISNIKFPKVKAGMAVVLIPAIFICSALVFEVHERLSS